MKNDKDRKGKIEVLFEHPAPVAKKVVYEPYLRLSANGHLASLNLRRVEEDGSESHLKIGHLHSRERGVTFHLSKAPEGHETNWPGVCFDDEGRIVDEGNH